MKTRLLVRVNMLIISLLAVLGFSSCNQQVKYGVPYEEPVEDKYGVPYTEYEEPTDSEDTPDNQSCDLINE